MQYLCSNRPFLNQIRLFKKAPNNLKFSEYNLNHFNISLREFKASKSISNQQNVSWKSGKKSAQIRPKKKIQFKWNFQTHSD